MKEEAQKSSGFDNAGGPLSNPDRFSAVFAMAGHRDG
jgi:hypothetical protein